MSNQPAVVVDTSTMSTETSVEIESDILRLRPLGAGQEVGRSCIYMEFKGKRILLDMGIHPGLNGMDALPFTDLIESDKIDLLLISHFHLDHCGALPWFLQKTTFKGRCFMTHATKAIYRWLLADCIKVSNLSVEQMLYTEQDLEQSMDKIETINFHEEKEVSGVRFWCYNAGHVLGAAMFMIEIAGVKVLYTGDFSRQEDRHLMSAEIPAIRPDVLIIESTYGTHIHEKREEREARFTGIIYDTVTRGGRCLIPVFALGRAQELLLILDEYWSQHPELHDIPIYYASSLAKKCMSVYQTYINAMNNRIKRQITINNPFVFKHISNLKSMDHFEDVGPCVVMASPGMMQNGMSRELFEMWCSNRRNCCIIAGYCVEGTLAKQILSEPEEIVSMTGQRLPRKCQVEYISFSAHTDYRQTSEFIRALRPPHIVMVHGEANEMGRLKSALVREYEDTENPPQFHNPKNTVSVELHFRGEKIAKVMGTLAMTTPTDGHQLSGILVKKHFSYHLLKPEDLHKYTDMTITTISQKFSVPVFSSCTSTSTSTTSHKSSSSSSLAAKIKECHLNLAFEKFVNLLETSCHFHLDINKDERSIRIANGAILATLQHRKTPPGPVVVFEWNSAPVTDMAVDSIVACLLKHDIEPDELKTLQQPQQDKSTTTMDQDIIETKEAHQKDSPMEIDTKQNADTNVDVGDSAAGAAATDCDDKQTIQVINNKKKSYETLIDSLREMFFDTTTSTTTTTGDDDKSTKPLDSSGDDNDKTTSIKFDSNNGIVRFCLPEDGNQVVCDLVHRTVIECANETARSMINRLLACSTSVDSFV